MALNPHGVSGCPSKLKQDSSNFTNWINHRPSFLFFSKFLNYDLQYSFYDLHIDRLCHTFFMGRNTVMNSRDRRDARRINPQHPQIVTKCLNGFLTVQRLKGHHVVSPWYWAGVYSQRAARGRKGEDTVYLFSEWRVSEVRPGFHTETMAHVHPAALALLLSLPILRLSLSASEQKHTAHPARRSAPAKSSLPAPQLFSFTPALFPGHALTAAYMLK